MSAARLAALRDAAGPVSRETFLRLEAFEAAFRRWAARINLAAPSTLPHLWERHVLDSAQLVRLAPDARRWLDLGSGGGFPGAVVALIMAEHDGAHVDLVESNRKKAAFLQTVLAELKAPAKVHARRIEDCSVLLPVPQIVTARALAPLERLLPLAEPWLAQGARGLFHKGRDYLREVEESGNVWQFDLVKHDAMTGDGVILEISSLLRRTPRR
ncbi:16S rRNA (guanine(527)-N(7))-methyltransferase RsmG [Chelativorans intermedius]|uniref:Ribosomal RNA small subunit methyltransferase G n=1 Tax=Chelativorans intermedius TaxID=515947 RepID=A0ABV6D8M5_9HYPH|nr:16S rRNA (guanine(527)-N(7))-methyltransferase RsmG [Chelativorans intermedius]MCT8998087.1 16S rRNA (guanine(527)-N(7))-methyltransferase RsmG [Chelativorans intermedius]